MRANLRRISSSFHSTLACCGSGSFKTKAGRLSPYFFNAGLFDDGAKLGRLAQFYARRLQQAQASGELQFDMLFGPAYKGIVLAAAVAVELARLGINVPYAYNRKEAKDHGEGGTLVGAPVRGRVLIIDDVISAGTSVRESIAMIEAAARYTERSGDRTRSAGKSQLTRGATRLGRPFSSCSSNSACR
jgi:orotate phosphoribosyltransferase